MGALKVVGGLLALAGGVLVLISWITLVMAYLPITSSWSLINLVAIVLAILGGILGLAGKKAGGVLALIAALIWILGIILVAIDPVNLSWMFPMSYLSALISLDIFVTYESVLVLLGAIFILAGGSE
jgi:hypothetical protein